LHFLFAPVFSLCWLCGNIDPHQSPIRIKAIVVQALRLSTTAPGCVAQPQKFIGAIPCPMGFSQILWLLANPLLVHGIGESSCKRKYPSLIESRQFPIKSDGFAANPYNGSLPGSNRFSFQQNLVHGLFLSFELHFMGMAQLPIKPYGSLPTPIMVPCGIQT